MSSIEFRDLTVAYGRQTVVHAFTETVKSGEWLGLIGPNGAGKSSLLKAVVGVVESRGEVLVDGSSIGLRSRSRRAALIAYVPQEPMMPSDMSGFDYVLLGRAPYVGYFGTESKHDRAMVADVLDRLELGEFAQRKLGRMSGGEKQRMVIARALATEAPILLLDEPTSSLDIGHQQQALELVARLRADHGLTVISAMHDLTLAGLYSDRLVLLHEGVVAASGAPEQVLRPDVLAEFYGVRVTVHRDDDGTIIVVPRRELM
jgi:iron complex transport system ATP-binding protein